MTNFQAVLSILCENRVEFVLIGGLAAVAHGCSTATSDLDVFFKHSRENIARIVSALGSHHVRLRGAPDDIPFVFDELSFQNTFNFTLMTDLGAVDLLSQIPGFDSFESIFGNSEEIELYNRKIRLISLDDLIKNKMATGRPKDRQFVAELNEIKKMKEK